MKIILFSSLALIVPILLSVIQINDTFAQIKVPTQFSTFQSDEHGIQMDHPSNWQKFGDVEAGDYETEIAIFAPSEEIKFNKFDSFNDYFKFDYRALIEYDYSFVLPKLNLPFALDKRISETKDIGSGFKGFKIIDSTTKSELGDKPAYKYTYEMQRKRDHFRYLETGTIINENQLIYLNFKAPAENFDLYLPTFEHMIDSFKFTEFENKSDTNQSSIVTNTVNNP